jgi:hypothetical protein
MKTMATPTAPDMEAAANADQEAERSTASVTEPVVTPEEGKGSA